MEFTATMNNKMKKMLEKKKEHNGTCSVDKQQNNSKEDIERKQKHDGSCNNSEHQTI